MRLAFARRLAAVVWLCFAPAAAFASSITLTPPGRDLGLIQGGSGGTRGDIVEVSAPYVLTSIGIEARIDLGASLTFSAYVWDAVGYVGVAPLAVGAPVVITGDGTLKFYDLAIAFTLLPGQQYDIGIDLGEWSSPFLALHYYEFDYRSASPFTVVPVTVFDGEESHNGEGNYYAPHLRLNGSSAVPEPASTVLLLGIGLAGLSGSRRLRR